MDLQTVLLVVGGLGGAAFLVWAIRGALRLEQRRQKAIDAVWSEAARRLGFTRRGSGMEGTFEGFQVRVERHDATDPPGYTRVTLSTGGKVSRDLVVHKETAIDGVRRAFGSNDVQIGEETFDRLVHVEGPEDLALAALSAAVRKPVTDWVSIGGVVRGGELVFDLMGDEFDAERIPATVRDLAARAEALSVESIPAALQANAANDPCLGVRRRNLEVLVARDGKSKEARAALEAALSDRESELLLFAAQHVDGPVAREALAKLVTNTEAPEEHRAKAVERLSQAHPWPAVRPVMSKALYTRGAKVRHAAVRAVGVAQDASLLDDLLTMLPTQDADLAEALAGAFEKMGGPRAEKGLVQLLQTSGHAPALRAAAQTLGRVGTVAAVEALVAHAEKGPIQDFARDAARAIQARLGDAEAGRLSVVDPGAAGGALSLESQEASADGKVRERG